ncbi:UbiA family prenyltransferase [Haloarchaeobius amylolyticus]|uniref:UbiA family prenyltransferase n=1 Tax=Haloarchaeobius amylolyticus TaxID=1198296 RepID=UPI00227056D7|nr:UbiA family prenyltransferase [Haloarchaeobius amylolyticus]
MSQSNDRFTTQSLVHRLPDPTEGVRSVVAAAVHTSLLDGAVAATKVVVVSALLSVSLSPAVALAFLVTFGVYGSNKLVDAEDAVNCPDRAAFVSRYRPVLALATVGGYGLALVLAALEGPMAVGLTLVPAAAAVLYSTEWVPYDGGTRVKDVFLLNTTLVAAAWAVYITFIPVAYAGQGIGASALTICAFFFLQTVVAGEVLNARDVVGDRQEGVSTLPTRLGVDRAQTVLYGLDGLTIVLLVGAGVAGTLGESAVLALLPAVAYSLLVTALVGRDVDLSRLSAWRDLEYPIMLAGVLLVL